jgi:hypothetical protein
MKRTVLWLVTALLLPACGAPAAPEVVAKRFYEMCEIGRQDGPSAVEGAVFAMLSTPSQEMLQAAATELNEKTSAQPPLQPAQCLVFDSTTAVRRDFSATRIADGKERVRLEVTSGKETHLLEMVLEDDWRIDLATTLALNAPTPDTR